MSTKIMIRGSIWMTRKEITLHPPPTAVNAGWLRLDRINTFEMSIGVCARPLSQVAETLPQ